MNTVNSSRINYFKMKQWTKTTRTVLYRCMTPQLGREETDQYTKTGFALECHWGSSIWRKFAKNMLK